jgi:phosphoribosylformylglycinamidine synthase
MVYKIAIIVFPGTNCDLDTYHVLSNTLRLNSKLIWHKSIESLNEYDAIILPGGFSYGDHLRAGVIAAFSPAMKEVKKAAIEGKPILGICNGFQILTEAELLPGALLRNKTLKFVCKWVKIRVDSTNTAFTNICKKGQILDMPIAHNEGRYFIDEDGLKMLKRNGQIVFTYVNEFGKATKDANPNGSVENIAGVCNKERNIVGLMPHPERASERILSPYEDNDGLAIFSSMLYSLGKVIKLGKV